MSTSQVVLTFHLIFFGVLLLGVGMAMAGMIGAAAASGPKEMLAFVGIAKAGGLVNLVAGTLLLVSGLWLVDLQGRDLGEPWIIASMVLWVVALGLAHVQKLHGMKVASAAAATVESGALSEEAAALANASQPKMIGTLLHLITITFVVLMVFKPGA